MAHAFDRDVLRQELIRLLDGLEFWRAWLIAAIEREKGAVTQDDLDQIVEPGSFFLDIFDEIEGRRCAEILKEVRLWYGHAAGDLGHMARLDGAAAQAEVDRFLLDFRQTVGFDFLAEAGLLRKTVDKVLKAGKIAKQEDYYVLIELENDMSQAVISAEECARVSDVLRKFECQAKVD